MAITGDAACGLEPDMVGYAVCRFVRKSRRLREEYVNRSYWLRFAKGKEKRRERLDFEAPAVLLELPGVWVRVSVTIDAAGVTVKRVDIQAALPSTRR